MSGVKRNRLVEWIKTGMIALLTASALFLGWQTKLFNDFFRAIPLFGNVAELVRGVSGPGPSESGGMPLKEAARPLTIVITDENGDRYGVRYDTIARNAVYERTSSIMSEALGSASAPREISEDEWRMALTKPGVYFEYFMPVRLSILDGWLAAKLPDTMWDASIRRVFVAFGEDRSRVYYQNSDNGMFFVAVTASSAGKAQELDIYSANGALFAFETGIGAAENAPYVLILPGSEYADIRATAVGSVEELLDMVRYATGHGNEAYTPYPGNDGALVHVGTQFNIRVDAIERVTYRRTDTFLPGSEEQIPNDSEIIERARLIAAGTIGNIESGAEVFFESLEYDAGGSRSVFFGYYIAGGRIHLYEDGYAARITFTGGTVTEMELNFRSFSQSGEFTRLYPERQALAAAGGEFLLCYSDTGAERLQPAWVHYN